RRDRKLAIPEQARQRHTDHQERRGDRPSDERLGDAHWLRFLPAPAPCPFPPPASPPPPPRACSVEPGRRWVRPSTPTRSPRARPLPTIARSPTVSAISTGRCCALPSGPARYTKVPVGPRCTAAAAITVASWRVSTSRRALTN